MTMSLSRWRDSAPLVAFLLVLASSCANASAVRLGEDRYPRPIRKWGCAARVPKMTLQVSIRRRADDAFATPDQPGLLRIVRGQEDEWPQTVPGGLDFLAAQAATMPATRLEPCFPQNRKSVAARSAASFADHAP